MGHSYITPTFYTKSNDGVTFWNFYGINGFDF
nr:MAG TPA: 2,3-bisphosphoglycerate-independent phosphoglycerate mutase [Caudoviricetes sp.]